MSLIDEIIPARRGRPPKARTDVDLTPIQRALSEALPASVLEAAEAVQRGLDVFTAMKANCRAAAAEISVSIDRRIAEAQRVVDSLRHAKTERESEVNRARQDLEEAKTALAKEKGVFRFGKSFAVEAAERAIFAAERKLASESEKLASVSSRFRDAQQIEAALDVDPVAHARADLARAEARRDSAAQFGGECPSPEEIAALEHAFAAAKANDEDRRAARVQALKEEALRQQQVLRDKVHALHRLLAPLHAKWGAAGNEQLATATTLIAQGQMLSEIMSGHSSVYSPFSFEGFDNVEKHTGQPELAGCEEIVNLHVILRMASESTFSAI